MSFPVRYFNFETIRGITGQMHGARWRLGFIILSLCFLQNAPGAVRVILPAAPPPPLQFAAAEIERAAEKSAIAADVKLEISGSGGPQSYDLKRAGMTVTVVGADAPGAMYGGLDVAEAIRLGSLAELKTGGHRPFIAQRGIKFNIPLDLRTPSYSDCSDSFQANIPEVWSRDFWRDFLDEMARQRFNVLSLWNLHPFPSIVKVPEYPDVALTDVWRTTLKLDDSFYSNGQDMVRPAMLAQHEVVKRLTMDEKIAFWRDVMQMAKDRGIDVYWFVWNTFLFGAEGKDGLSRANPDANLTRYFRASVRETVNTYPLLAGIGITAGENMGGNTGGASKETWFMPKEEWLWQTYGEGIRDALTNQPGRVFRMIHRLHESNLKVIARAWKDYPGPFDFSYKYSVAHMYGMTRPTFIDPLLPELSPARRSWLTVRNDDIYSFRWADPQFARDFIREMPGPDKIAGFYMGPDGYCWGREAMDLEPESPRQLVMRKQWFSFMLWGRLSYDPTISDELFKRTLAVHFPEVPAAKLLTAWSAASRVFPETTRFFWRNIDVQWLPEACLSHPKSKGFYTVRHFMEGNTEPDSGNLDIRQWRANLLNGRPMSGTTPLQVAANLRSDGEAALRGAAELRAKQGSNKELRLTLGDIEAFGQIGLYYSEKIEGACELALFDAGLKPEHRDAAIKHLEAALGHWRDYAATYSKQYKQPLLYNRVGVVDIPKLTEKAAADIEIARNWTPGTIPVSVPRRTSSVKDGQ